MSISNRQLFNSWVLLYDNNFTGWISAVTTSGSAKFTIPATGRPGKHLLEVLHGDSLSLDIGRGPVGTTFRIHLKSVGWSETANIVHVVYDNSYIGYACAFNSRG